MENRAIGAMRHNRMKHRFWRGVFRQKARPPRQIDAAPMEFNALIFLRSPEAAKELLLNGVKHHVFGGKSQVFIGDLWDTLSLSGEPSNESA